MVWQWPISRCLPGGPAVHSGRPNSGDALEEGLANAVDEAKREAAAGTHLLSMFGLAAGVRASLGHVSMRVPGQPDRFVVIGRGYRADALPAIRPEDMVVVDMDGVWVDGPRNIVPCFEVKIHSCILRDHPNV